MEREKKKTLWRNQTQGGTWDDIIAQYIYIYIYKPGFLDQKNIKVYGPPRLPMFLSSYIIHYQANVLQDTNYFTLIEWGLC